MASGDPNNLGLVNGGPPSYGTFTTGQWVTDVAGGFWVCTATGSPGTWAHVSSLGAANTWTGAQTFTGASTFSTGPVLNSCALTVPEGTNAYMGTVAVSGTSGVTVATTAVTANSRIFLTTQVPGGTVATSYVSSTSVSTNFVIKSTGANDLSTVAWLIVNHT